MEHITDIAWVDYVRHSSSPAITSFIDRHLASGCSWCQNAALLWKSLAEAAARERQYSVPYEVVRLVESQFSVVQLATPAHRARASLSFDSFAQPLPAGVRSHNATARQLVYETDGVTVDLRIDKQANSQGLSIVGQVLDARTLRLASEPVPVALLNREGKPLQFTSTSHFGEFHLEVPVEVEMQLAIELDAGRKLCVRLPTGSSDPASDLGEQNRLPGCNKERLQR